MTHCFSQNINVLQKKTTTYNFGSTTVRNQTFRLLVADLPETWSSVWKEAQRDARWWEPPSQSSASSDGHGAPLAPGWRKWAGSSVDLEI